MDTEEIVTHIAQPSIGGKINGWMTETLGEGASAACQTCCSPCVLLTAILVLFIGEYNWVKDQNNIMQIDKDMIDGVTMYEAANDGKPVAFYAASNKITTANITDSDFGVVLSDVMKAERVASIVSSTAKSTKSSDGQTMTYSCDTKWTSTSTFTTVSNYEAAKLNACVPKAVKDANKFPFDYNRGYKGPCPQTTSCGDTFQVSEVKADQFTVPQYLLDYYTRRNTATVTDQSTWGGNWNTKTTLLPANDTWFACGNYLSNNRREELSLTHDDNGNPVCVNPGTSIDTKSPFNLKMALQDDHSVSWEAWKVPSAGFTICSKQKGQTFEELKDNGSYDLMLPGKKSKKDCIDTMKDAAKATVMIMRVLGFILFWCGFCMMFAIVSFFADRVGSLIPCGLGEMFSDCVDCMITVVTCPPACACWIFWWSLAWLIFNPMPYGIVFLVAVVLMAAMTWWFKQQEGKGEETPEKEEPIVADQQQNWNTEPAAQPWSSNDTPTQPPPPADDNVDANNDGIPDKFQDGLPPGWTAAVDHSSGRIYWIDHNSEPAASTWQDPRAPSSV
jgi:hypothetical protein